MSLVLIQLINGDSILGRLVDQSDQRLMVHYPMQIAIQERQAASKGNGKPGLVREPVVIPWLVSHVLEEPKDPVPIPLSAVMAGPIHEVPAKLESLYIKATTNIQVVDEGVLKRLQQEVPPFPGAR